MNLCEQVFARREYEKGGVSKQVLRGCEVASPACPLLAANTSAVRYRWKKRSVCSQSDSGSAVGPERTLGKAIGSAEPWRTQLVCEHNLSLNDCIFGFDERGLEERLGATDDNMSAATLCAASCAANTGIPTNIRRH